MTPEKAEKGVLANADWRHEPAQWGPSHHAWWSPPALLGHVCNRTPSFRPDRERQLRGAEGPLSPRRLRTMAKFIRGSHLGVPRTIYAPQTEWHRGRLLCKMPRAKGYPWRSPGPPDVPHPIASLPSATSHVLKEQPFHMSITWRREPHFGEVPARRKWQLLLQVCMKAGRVRHTDSGTNLEIHRRALQSCCASQRIYFSPYLAKNCFDMQGSASLDVLGDAVAERRANPLLQRLRAIQSSRGTRSCRPRDRGRRSWSWADANLYSPLECQKSPKRHGDHAACASEADRFGQGSKI